MIAIICFISQFSLRGWIIRYSIFEIFTLLFRISRDTGKCFHVTYPSAEYHLKISKLIQLCTALYPFIINAREKARISKHYKDLGLVLQVLVRFKRIYHSHNTKKNFKKKIQVTTFGWWVSTISFVWGETNLKGTNVLLIQMHKKDWCFI